MSFLKDKSPKGATDILKVLVILGLPFVHTLQMVLADYAKEELYSIATGIGALIVFGGPVFMLCLGVDLFENRSYKSIIKMGIEISMINIVFNFLRYGIPDLFYVIPGYIPSYWTWASFMFGDIYCFAGLFCICYGFAKKFKWSLGVCTLASLGMFVLNTILGSNPLTVSEPLGYFIGNFVSGYLNAYFALLGWAIFPVLGMWIGKAMKLEKKKRDRVFAIILIGSVAALIVYSLILQGLGTNVVELMVAFAYYHSFGPFQAITMVLAALLVVSLMYLIYGLIPQNKFETKVIMCSNLVMPFYLIQFLILAAIIYIPEFFLDVTGKGIFYFGIPLYWSVSIGVTVVTAIICYWKGFTFTRWLFKVFDYQRWFKKKKKKNA